MTSLYSVQPLEWLQRIGAYNSYGKEPAQGPVEILRLPLSIPSVDATPTALGIRTLCRAVSALPLSEAFVLELATCHGVTYCIAIQSSDLVETSPATEALGKWRTRLVLLRPPEAPGYHPAFMLAVEQSPHKSSPLLMERCTAHHFLSKTRSVTDCLDDVLHYCTTHHVFTTTELTP